jgi:hypothetical protein
VNGRGRDIEGSYDEFYYVYRQLSTLGEIVVQVNSVDNTHPWAKAGLMIRDTLDPTSSHAAVYVTPGSGVSFQYRDVGGGATGNTTVGGITAPVYLKLKRDYANTMYAYYSTDGGSTWNDANAAGEDNWETLTVTDPVYIGLAVCSHNADALCQAVFDNVSVTVSGMPSAAPSTGLNIGTNDPEQLYVALEDGSGVVVVNHNDVNAATVTDWTEWNVKLSDFTGLDTSNVQKVYMGLGDRSNPQQGGGGILFVDDIRVCPPRCVASISRPVGDIATPYDCTVDEKDLAVMAGDWLLFDYVSDPLVGWYELEGDPCDSSIYGHDGNDLGDPNYATGQIGQAIVFDPNYSNYVVIGDVGIGGAEPRTIACWAKRTVLTQSNWTNIFGFTGASGANLHFDFEVVGGTATTTQNYTGLHVYGSEWDLSAPDLAWHHFAATYDGTTVTGYTDGSLVFSNNHPGLNTHRNVHMGKRGDNTNYFAGLVDDARIYDKALSQTEIQSIMGGGLGTVSDHHPMVYSPANLYDNEPNGLKRVNFKDYSIMTESWLEKETWP